MRDYELIIYRTFPDGRDRLLHGMAGLISEYEEGAMERQTAGTGGDIRVPRQSVALLSDASAGEPREQLQPRLRDAGRDGGNRQ